MYIKEYMPEYREAMEKVCLATASEKARTDKKHGQFSLLMYCDEYLDRELAYMLMNDEDTPVGYILCAKDVGRILRTFKIKKNVEVTDNGKIII